MPATEDRAISEFPRALQLLATALIEVSNPDGLGAYDTNSVELTELGRVILGVQYTQQLGNVSVFDAIKNTRVLSGTTTPLANEGANGQLYVKYETVSDVDSVVGMYFKKDGEWLEISLGGGGGSSTLAGLSDVDLTTPTGGQALIYDDVNDEWVNGDVSQVIVYPIAVTSQMVSASSTVGSNFEGYRAFDGQSCNLSTLQGGWLAGQNDSTPTLTVNFGEAKKLGRISIETANNNNPDTTRDVYIEGSSDGFTWENILASGSTVSLVFEVGKYNEYSFNLNEGEYQYFRIRGTQPFFGGSFQYACSFSEITIYDTSSGVPAIADLTDVDISSPANGQLLRYNGTSGKWENAGIINDTTASTSSVYSSNKTDTLLALKADKSDVYTKTQIDTSLSGKQDTLSETITLTRHPNAPSTLFVAGAARQGKFCVISLLGQLKAGTYYELYTSNVSTAVQCTAIVAVGSQWTLVTISGSTIRFNNQFTVSADSWMIGELVFKCN